MPAVPRQGKQHSCAPYGGNRLCCGEEVLPTDLHQCAVRVPITAILVMPAAFPDTGKESPDKQDSK